VSRLPCQAHKAEEQESEARGIGPALTGLFEEVIDPVQPENTHDDQIDRHRDANDAGRDQQKYSRGQAGNRHQGVGGIEVHRELIPDSEAPSAGRRGLASALVPACSGRAHQRRSQSHPGRFQAAARPIVIAAPHSAAVGGIA
jgi:hypothetical protein